MRALALALLLALPTALSEEPAPEARFTLEVDHLAVVANATGSTPANATYLFSWGDAYRDASASPVARHVYGEAGTFVVTLSLFPADGGDLLAAAERNVTVAPPPGDRAPVASFEVEIAGMTVVVDANASRDEEGPLAELEWTWGDGSASRYFASPPLRAGHAYAKAGNFTVELRVRDASGQNARANRTVQVESLYDLDANFSFVVDGLTVRVFPNTTGPQFWHEWDWNDGLHDYDDNRTHTFREYGTYYVMHSLHGPRASGQSFTRRVQVLPPPAPSQASSPPPEPPTREAPLPLVVLVAALLIAARGRSGRS